MAPAATTATHAPTIPRPIAEPAASPALSDLEMVLNAPVPADPGQTPLEHLLAMLLEAHARAVAGAERDGIRVPWRFEAVAVEVKAFARVAVAVAEHGGAVS